MDRPNVLIVGPASGVGGITQYIDGQTEHLSSCINVEVYDVSVRDSEGYWDYSIAAVFAFIDILLFPFQSRPDIIHVHTSHRFSFYQSSFYILFSKLIWCRPVILHIHGSSFDEFLATDSKPVSWLQQLVFDASDIIIVLSDYWRKLLSKQVPDAKILPLPNAVDETNYDPCFTTGNKGIIFISNLIERKGVLEFITSVQTLIEESNYEFSVSIAGKGPLSHHAERLAEDFESVEYYGYVSESEKQSLLNQSSIYVLPTYAEGLPVALLEGMAGGNAIVATNVGAIPEVIEKGGGKIVSPGRTDELIVALEELLAAPEEIKRLGRRNRTLVETEYNWDRISKRLEQLYKGITDDKIKYPISENYK